jgi:hypothetical protein
MLQTCPHFHVPWGPFRSGLILKMKPAQLNLWLVLLHEVERYSTRELTRSDRQLGLLVKISQRSLRDARIKLSEYGLIRYERTSGAACRYTICDPRTGLPFPGKPREKRAPVNAGNSETSARPALGNPAAPTETGQSKAPAPECQPENSTSQSQPNEAVFGVPLKW